MKQLLHRLPVSRKFMLALALPLLAMVYFAATGVIGQFKISDTRHQPRLAIQHSARVPATID